MDTELCVYLDAGRFTIIVSVHFHDNRGSQYGAKYDDKLMHTAAEAKVLAQKICSGGTTLIDSQLIHAVLY